MAKKLQSKEALARSVKKLAQKGLTAMEIGQELGYTNVRINQIAREFGITINRRKKKTVWQPNVLTERGQRIKAAKARPETICIYCRRTNLRECTLFDPRVTKPPQGAAFQHSYVGYKVTECPRFEEEKCPGFEAEKGNS